MSENVLLKPMRLPSGSQTEPWYRQPWPWILMAGPAMVVVAGFYTLYLAIIHADPLVIDNYYKEGLAINQVMARDHLAAQRGYRAVLMLNPQRTLVRVQLTGIELPPSVRVHLVHPANAELDREVVAVQIGDGLYQSSVQMVPAARWNVELTDPGRSWRLTADWRPATDTVVLEASPR